MEFFIYFSNFGRVSNIEEALHSIDYRNKPFHIIQTFFGEIKSSEYYNNLVCLDYLQTQFSKGLNFSGLYFGQEFCEYLIPDIDDLKKAYYTSRQLGWDFTYVTGYLTDRGINKTRQNLEFLVSEDDGIEVVVNDWGLLNVINREYSSLCPVLGRMLIKQKRLARFSDTPPVNMNGIDVSVNEIVENQQKALRQLNLSIKSYRQELKKLGVKRIEVDIVPQGVEIAPKEWDISVSCYYPWTYLTCGRNCSTAAIDDPVREYVVVDEPCSRPCQKFNRTSNMEQFSIPILQRGNTIFGFTHKYASLYLKGNIPIDRVIFEPYIPII